jgi:hypothetical protein
VLPLRDAVRVWDSQEKGVLRACGVSAAKGNEKEIDDVDTSLNVLSEAASSTSPSGPDSIV